MHRSSESVAAIATALAKAQIELSNPEKAMVGTIYNSQLRESAKASATPRCRAVWTSSERSLGGHQIADAQTTDIDRAKRNGQPDDRPDAHLWGVDLVGLAGLSVVRDIRAPADGCGADLRPPLCAVHDGRDRRRGRPDAPSDVTGDPTARTRRQSMPVLLPISSRSARASPEPATRPLRRSGKSSVAEESAASRAELIREIETLSGR